MSADPPGSADPQDMAGWAQLLHDIVERRLRPSDRTDLLAPSWDAMFDDALAAVMQEMLASRLEQLTPEQLVAAYRAVRGDDALLDQLTPLLAERAEAARREQTILRLNAQASVAGRLELCELDPGETLEIGLFDPTQPRLAAWRFRDNAEKRPLQRVLRVRVTTPASGEVDVISDTWTGAIWADRWRTDSLEPMSRARVGTRLAGSTDVLPELTLHAPVVVVLDCGPEVTPPQITGYVRTLDGRLLLDARVG